MFSNDLENGLREQWDLREKHLRRLQKPGILSPKSAGDSKSISGKVIFIVRMVLMFDKCMCPGERRWVRMHLQSTWKTWRFGFCSSFKLGAELVPASRLKPDNVSKVLLERPIPWRFSSSILLHIEPSNVCRNQPRPGFHVSGGDGGTSRTCDVSIPRPVSLKGSMIVLLKQNQSIIMLLVI